MLLDVDPMKVRYQPSMNAPDKFGTRPVWVKSTRSGKGRNASEERRRLRQRHISGFTVSLQCGPAASSL
jgi:hypothetical protein